MKISIIDLDMDLDTDMEYDYSHPRKYDNRRARSHEEMEGSFSDDKAAEEGLATREKMSIGDLR